jgi:Trm5-related predicted tRNA methylase
MSLPSVFFCLAILALMKAEIIRSREIDNTVLANPECHSELKVQMELWYVAAFGLGGLSFLLL